MEKFFLLPICHMCCMSQNCYAYAKNWNDDQYDEMQRNAVAFANVLNQFEWKKMGLFR